MPVSVLLENIAPTVSCTTSDKSIFAVPSKETPWIVLAFCKAVAVAEFPVILLEVKAKVPAVAGKVTDTLPEYAECGEA